MAEEAEKLREKLREAEHAHASMANEIVTFTAMFCDGSQLELETSHVLRDYVFELAEDSHPGISSGVADSSRKA